MSDNDQSAGFSLIEVLASFVILSGVFLSLYEVAQQALVSTKNVRAERDAMSLARAKFFQISTQETIAEGISVDEQAGYSVKSEISLVPSEGQINFHKKLYRLRIYVEMSPQVASHEAPLIDTIILM